MSVYNRKMFKRNARDTLNKSAGIAEMPVQKFQSGGSIRIGNNSFMVSPGANPKVFQRTNQGTAIPVNPNVAAQVLARFRSPQLDTRITLEEAGIAPLKKMVDTSGAVALQQPEVAGIAGATTPKGPYTPFQGYPLASGTEKFLFGEGAAQTVGEDITRKGVLAIPSIMDVIGTSGANVLTGISKTMNQMSGARQQELLSGKSTITPEEALRINAGITSVSPELAKGMLSGDIAAPGVDLIKLGGVVTSEGVYSQGAVSPEEEAANLALLQNLPSATQLKVEGKDIAAPDPMQEPPQVPYAPDRSAATAETDTTAQAAGAEAAVATPEDREAVREAGTYEKEYPTTKEQVESIITEGTPEEQEKTLADFMKEFEENAPGYGSNNQGLILAKMGFAMAAGKSPRAIENIAAAMEQGADDLIKDNAKRDEYKRQIKLSALKYGLQETGKLKAEERAIAKERRGIVDYVAGPDGTFYKGREYGPNETVPVSVGDIRDGNLPAGVLNTATLDSLAKQATAYNKTLTSLREQRSISPSEYDKQLGAYNEAVTTAIQSETGIALLEGAMINVAEGKVTGVTPALKDMLNRGSNFFGMELGKDYETKDDVRNAMRASLQDLIPVTLGSSQTANSISNRDVDFLIEAYFGKSALDGGVLTFATTDPDQMVKRLQRAATKMRQEQKNAFTIMSQKEAQLAPLYQPGTQVSAANLLAADQQRLAEAGLTPQGGISKTSFGYTMGDDGVLRYTN